MNNEPTYGRCPADRAAEVLAQELYYNPTPTQIKEQIQAMVDRLKTKESLDPVEIIEYRRLDRLVE